MIQQIQTKKATDETYFTERQERRLSSKNPTYAW